MRKKEKENLEKCFYNICKNFDIVSNLRISELGSNASHFLIETAFIDTYSSVCVNFDQQEIKINTSKDYKRLKRLIRSKLIQALIELKCLADDGLKSLGFNQQSYN